MQETKCAFLRYTVKKIKEKGAGPPLVGTGSRKKFPIILCTISKISKCGKSVLECLSEIIGTRTNDFW